MSDHDLLAKARMLEPLKQGGLDGLCGIYAIINALLRTPVLKGATHRPAPPG